MGNFEEFPPFRCPDNVVSANFVLKVEFPDEDTTEITMNGAVSKVKRVADFEYLIIPVAYRIEIIEIKY